MSWAVALVVATAVHLGFQLTVSLVVYPALVVTPAETWSAVHAAHSRRIAPLVVLLYVALLATATGTVLSNASDGAVVAAVAIVLTIGLTAAAAAPLHARLRSRRDDTLLRALTRVDQLRTLFALIALLAAMF